MRKGIYIILFNEFYEFFNYKSILFSIVRFWKSRVQKLLFKYLKEQVVLMRRKRRANSLEIFSVHPCPKICLEEYSMVLEKQLTKVRIWQNIEIYYAKGVKIASI